MIIKEIKEKEYINFMNNNSLSSFYQSIEWQNIKKKNGRECELIGLFNNNILVGASLIIYNPILKKFKYAYASRGLVYDYENIKEMTEALYKYFKEKKVVFFRMDPPIVLAKYDKNQNRNLNEKSQQLIYELIANGFCYFGYNKGYEATQFRFVHILKLKNSFEEMKTDMSKSAKKNMMTAIQKGVKIREISAKELPKAYYFFTLTNERKHIHNLPISFYEDILKEFKNAKLYITYIDKETYLNNIKELIKENEKEMKDLQYKKANIMLVQNL